MATRVKLNRSLGATLLALGLLSGSSAEGEIGTIDTVPAATLLVPYFSVDLDDPYWDSTLISVNNASPDPVIAHFTLWTDLSIPTLDFNVYLTGYDVFTLNLRDLFETGVLPATSHSNPAISPVGPFSNVTNPASGVGPGSVSCNDQLPLPPLPVVLLEHIRAAHTGEPSPIVFGGLCSGYDHPDNVARGYITIDSVNFCSLQFPGEPGYWQPGGTGVGNNLNVLWGDVMYVSDTHQSAQGLPLVHLEASDELGSLNYTFYRRYSGGDDQREGLGSTFATRFLNGGLFDGGSDLIVWRDAKRPVAPFSCALPYPAPFPLSLNQLVIFDEQENPDVPRTSPFSPPVPGDDFSPFFLESQLADAGELESLGTPFDFGWLYLNLNNSVVGSQVPFEPLMQNYVQVVMTAQDRFSVGFDAIQLDNVTVPAEAMDFQLGVCDGEPDPPSCPD